MGRKHFTESSRKKAPEPEPVPERVTKSKRARSPNDASEDEGSNDSYKTKVERRKSRRRAKSRSGSRTRKLTDLRKKLINEFIEKAHSRPEKYGRYGSEKWMDKVIAHIDPGNAYGILYEDILHWIDITPDFNATRVKLESTSLSSNSKSSSKTKREDNENVKKSRSQEKEDLPKDPTQPEPGPSSSSATANRAPVATGTADKAEVEGDQGANGKLPTTSRMDKKPEVILPPPSSPPSINPVETRGISLPDGSVVSTSSCARSLCMNVTNTEFLRRLASIKRDRVERIGEGGAVLRPPQRRENPETVIRRHLRGIMEEVNELVLRANVGAQEPTIDLELFQPAAYLLNKIANRDLARTRNKDKSIKKNNTP